MALAITLATAKLSVLWRIAVLSALPYKGKAAATLNLTVINAPSSVLSLRQHPRLPPNHNITTAKAKTEAKLEPELKLESALELAP